MEMEGAYKTLIARQLTSQASVSPSKIKETPVRVDEKSEDANNVD